jgi:hypothetical protein
MRNRSNSSKTTRQRRGEAGYAYLMALFMVLMVVVSSQVILRNIATEARSQREGEAIWRGNQYVRAVKTYYRKTGHYPQSQDDLLTGQPGIHFLRSEVVNDPMNKADGKWRFIYTNASGAIIGSVKYGSLQQMALMDMNGGQMPGQQNANGNSTAIANGQNSTDNSNSSNSANSANSATPGSNAAPAGANSGLGAASLFPPQTGQAFGSAPGQTNSQTGGLNAAAMGPQPTGPVDGPVFGGQIIGVGSTVDRGSVRVYKGGKKYNEWEFIWNPIEEQAQAVQGLVSGAGATPGVGMPGLPLGPTNALPQSSNAPNTNTGTDNNGAGNNNGGTTNSPAPTQ